MRYLSIFFVLLVGSLLLTNNIALSATATEVRVADGDDDGAISNLNTTSASVQWVLNV